MRLLCGVLSSVRPQYQIYRQIRNLGLKTVMGRQALLLSSSKCYGYDTLQFAKKEVEDLFERNSISEVLFIPYAQYNHDEYTKKIADIMGPWGYTVNGIHTHSCPVEAVKSARAIFVGGGNTFVLLKTLYSLGLVDLIKTRVLKEGLVYIGSSAGTNVATASIHTTNDMPIEYPPSFDAIGIVPFNVNPHYIDVLEGIKHQGETRDQRIMEFLHTPHARHVVGLREGAILDVDNDTISLKGVAGAVVFTPQEEKIEFAVGSSLTFLLTDI